MLDVIDLLEKMGQDAQWSGASPDAIEIAMGEAGILPELTKAIVVGDQESLRTLLGILPVCGMLNPGKEEDEEDDSEEPSRENEDESESSISLHLSTVA